MLHIFYAVSVAIVIELTIIWAFFVNDKWTFGNLPKIVPIRIRFVKYNILSLTGLGVNEFVLILLTEKAGINYLESEFIAIIVTFFYNFTVHKKISWKY
jgi:putative flippase GtrA